MTIDITYTHHKISKGNGKYRYIYAPNQQLKEKQNEILQELYKKQPHPANHGFIPGKSIVTNAAHHIGRNYVLSMDIKDFFPSTKISKVKEILTRFYPNQLKNLPLLTYLNHIPQGAPTSPYIANFALYDFDQKLSIYCESIDACYTRYADDITISFDSAPVKDILNFVNTNLNKEDYYLSFKKTHLAHKSKRQKVTGIVVNEKLSIPYEIRNNIRAYNHLIKNKKFNEDQIPWAMGLNGYLEMTK